MHAEGPVPDPHAHDNRTREEGAPEPWPHASRDRQRWTATPQGRPPITPAARSPPQGLEAKGTDTGPPCPRTRARNTRMADPDSPPKGRAAGYRRAPDLRRPSQQHRVARATRTTGGAHNAHKSRQTPGHGANLRAPLPGPAAPTARAPAAGNPHTIPCS